MKKLNLKNEKVLGYIGMATTLLGVGITLVDNVVEERSLDIKIGNKVAEALKHFEIKDLGISDKE